MTTDKRARDADYRDLPYLLKPPPKPEVRGRRPDGAPVADSAVEANPPPPPCAGFNPYFDLRPESDRPASVGTKGLRR